MSAYLTPTVGADASEWFAQTLQACGFQQRYPAYAFVLGKLDPVFDSQVPVMAVSAAARRIRLHINPAFFTDQPQFLRGVLLHEVHHVVLGHLSQSAFSGVAFPDLLELAMEMSANEFIREPLPGEPVVWQRFENYGIRANQDTAERYELLAQARRCGKLRPLPVSALDGHETLVCRPGGTEAAGEAEVIVERILAELAASSNAGQGSAALIAGSAPGNLLAQLRSDVDNRTALDWRVELAMFCVSLRERTWSYMRPNRRFPDRIGQVPGRTRASRRPHLVAAIDTSGSMDDATLVDIAAQIRSIADVAQVTVVECDAEIQRVYPFRGGIDSVKGRGGTDLRPVFAPAFIQPLAPDGIVYFTDGQGPYADAVPALPTLWVLSGSARFPCPWGRQARLSKDDAAATSRRR